MSVDSKKICNDYSMYFVSYEGMALIRTCRACLRRGNQGLYNVPGHMTNMAAMPIYGKTPQNIYSGTGNRNTRTTKLGMKH